MKLMSRFMWGKNDFLLSLFRNIKNDLWATSMEVFSRLEPLNFNIHSFTLNFCFHFCDGFFSCSFKWHNFSGFHIQSAFSVNFSLQICLNFYSAFFCFWFKCMKTLWNYTKEQIARLLYVHIFLIEGFFLHCMFEIKDESINKKKA